MALFAIALKGQQPSRDSDAVRIAASMRSRGESGAALAILTQTRGPRSKQDLDAVADTLTEIAASLPGDDVTAVRTRNAARQTILLAGIGKSGTPYPGAAARLLQIAERSNSGGALWGLTQLPNKTESLGYLRKVATSDSKIAYAAVGHLARDTGPEGLAILRDLYRRGLITEPRARDEAATAAHVHGWK
jgi:hypothetical protein